MEKDELAIKYYIEEKASISATAKKFKICNKRLSKLLKEKDVLRNSGSTKYSFNENYFKEIDSNEKAYWIGFILADGCIKKDNAFQITLSEQDEKHIQRFIECINGDFKIVKEKRSYDGKYNSVLRIKRVSFSKDLENLGISKNKSTNEKPIEMKDEYIRHFIRGIFDGDGWLNFSEKSREFGVCSSIEICEYIKDHLDTVLEVHSNKVIKNNSKKDNDLYRIRYTRKNDIKKIMDYLYEDTDLYLERKYDKYNNFRDQL